MGRWDKFNRSFYGAVVAFILEEQMICEAEVILKEGGEEASQTGTEFLGKGLMDARTILISDPVDHKLDRKSVV